MNTDKKTPEQTALAEKLQDLEQGFDVEMSPDEAELLGAFREEALSEQAAKDSGDNQFDESER